MQNKMEIWNRVTESGVIAVFRKVPKDKAIKVAESLIDGGVNALEITVESENALEIIEQLSSRFKDRAIIGAGTVLDAHAAESAIKSGADFILSPTLKREVVETTIRYGKVSIPGVLTPTEMLNAIEYGADMVKIFPAASVGPAFIKYVHGPLAHIPIIPTGGIDLDNTGDFIKAGAIAVGAGGNLLDNKAIQNEDYEKLTNLAVRYVEAVRSAREEK